MSVPERIEESLTLGAQRRPGATALVAAASEYSYAQLVSASRDFGSRLRSQGLQPGDRVGIYLDATPAAVMALYGTWLAGGVAVPIHSGLKRRQLQHILEHSGARCVVVSGRGRTQLPQTCKERCNVLDVGAALPEGQAAAATDFADLQGGSSPAAILYTSGSTGRPKGILISHANLLAGARIVSSYLGLRDRDRLISVLPFSFDYGLNQLLSSVHVGATLVLQRSAFPADICRTLQEQEITGMAAVPPLWIQLMGDQSPLPGMDLPKLRYITNSGGVFPVELVQRYRAKFPEVEIFLMYGLSEAFRSSFLPPTEIDRIPESMGRAIPETELLVQGDDGSECEPGQVGELVHRGPTVSLGYWNDPEATDRVFRPDPLDPSSRVVHSGDLVKRDADGFLFFVGRRDQMLKSFGFRMSPDEVEEQLFASELVAEVAVVGEADAVAGTAIVAHVVPADSADFREPELLAWCRRELPHYMQPKRLEVHDALPRTSSGKLDRKALS